MTRGSERYNGRCQFLDHVLSAIDMNYLASNETASGTCKKHTCRSEFIDLAKPAQRDLGNAWS